MADAWLITDRRRALRDGATIQLRGAGPIAVEAPPGARLKLAGRTRALRSVDDRMRWQDDRWLSKVAGAVHLRVELGERTIEVTLVVFPMKLDAVDLATLLDELDTLALDLDPASEHAPAAPDVVRALEAWTGPISDAAAAIRRHPLHRRREQVRAVPTTSPRLSARDVRWLARHPAAEARAGGGLRETTVRRDVHRDLDLAENRGVIGVFDRMDRALGIAQERIGRTARRIEVRDALLAAAPAPRGRKPARSKARARLDAHHERTRQLRDQLARARGRTGLPHLPAAATLRRSQAVDAHPGYWRLYRVDQELGALPTSAPRVWAPVPDLDQLWEVWSVLEVARALAAWAGVPIAELMRVDDDGHELALPQGPVATFERDGVTVRLMYEPAYAYDGDERLAKLQPGQPWRPDAVLEISRHGHVVALHVFDAKHRRDAARHHDGCLPLDALQEIWFHYGDGIGDRHTGLPLVASVWMIWPGAAAGLRLQAPAMLDDAWPLDRLRGGAIGLRPGVAEGRHLLEEVVATLLDAELAG